MCQRPVFFAAFLLCLASVLLPVASANSIAYQITVNTSSITGTAGWLDFNFNPGPLISQAASLQILAFNSNGTLAGPPSVIGDVSGGLLPAMLTFSNGTGLNDYFEAFSFGTMISFEVSLFGPALCAPDRVSTSGSTFAFSMFSDTAGTIPALTRDTTDGFALTANVNLDATTTVKNSSAQTAVALELISGVPEPGTLFQLSLAIGVSILFQTLRSVRPGTCISPFERRLHSSRQIKGNRGENDVKTSQNAHKH